MSNTADELKDVMAEAIVVGTLLYKPDMLMHIDWLKSQHFTDKTNRCLFWALSSLIKDGIEHVDALSLSRKLSSNEGCKSNMDCSIEALQKRIDLSAKIVRSDATELKEIAKTVMSLAYRRDVVGVTQGMTREAIESTISVAELNRKMTGKLDDLIIKYTTSDEINYFGVESNKMWEDLDSREENCEFGFPSKFHAETGNFFTYEKTELVVVGGRMKAGKSCMMMNEALYQAGRGIPTVYFDTEMSDANFFFRTMANISGVEVNKIKHKIYNSDERMALVKANEYLRNLPLFHIYQPENDFDKLYSTCKMLKHKYGIEFVVYDYIKADGSATDATAISAKLGMGTDILKNKIAGELNLAVLAGCQLSREGMIADSDKIARNASTVMYWSAKTIEQIQRDGKEAGNYSLRVAFNRNGGFHSEEEGIYFAFDGYRQRIELASKQQRDCTVTPFAV